MNDKYYLLRKLYQNFNVGTVLRFDGKKFTDIQKNKDHKFNEFIPSDWIEIKKDEAYYLINIDINKRIDYNERRIFDCLSNLNVSDKCYHIKEKGKRLCTVNRKTFKIDGIYYLLTDEKGLAMTIPLHQIELLDENEIRNRLNNSLTNNETKLPLVKGIYLDNTVDITNIERLQSCDIVDKLVCIKDTPPIYGRVMFKMSVMGQSLTGLKIITEYLKDYDKKLIFFTDINACRDARLIIVKSDNVSTFHGQLRYLRNSKIIDAGSIKVTEYYESELFKRNDIVKYESGFKIVTELKLLNDIPCVGVKNSICLGGRDDELRYIEEDNVTKMVIEDYSTKSLEGIIIDPSNVAICVPVEDDEYKKEDKIEIKLKRLGKNLEGIIKLLVDVNDSLNCAIIEIKSSKDIDLSNYRINDLPQFKEVTESKKDIIIVLLNAVHHITTKIEHCRNNNVLVLNSESVREPISCKKEDKIIQFRSKDSDVIARLLWIGKVYGEEYIGCEMRFDSPYGTNGRFGDTTLFYCANGRGVLIPLKKVDQCCINDGHRDIRESNVGMIEGSSVCCAENGGNADIQLGAKVKRESNKGDISGICRWIGLVNGVKVIGVEMTKINDQGNDECLDKMKLFDCPSNRRGLFRSDSFKQEYYVEMVIPESDRIFKEINVNSKVIYYNRINDRLENMYGIVRWSGKDDNNEYVYGIELDNKCCIGTDGVFMGQRLFRCEDGHGIVVSIDLVAPDIRFIEIKGTDNIDLYEWTIIDPHSVVTVESIPSDKLMLDTNVKFRLSKCYRKYCGSLKWTGSINNVMCTVIAVDNVSPDDSLDRYICSKSIIDKMNLSHSDNLFIVIMAAVRKRKEKYEYLKRMLGRFNDKDFGVDILMDLISNEDGKTLRNVIKEWKCKINLDRYPELLPKLLKEDNYEVISILLDNIVASDRDDVPLIYIAKRFITTGDHRRFIEASKKCINRNIVLDNGETFITDVMKTCGDEAVINRVIGSNLFNINQVNKYGESPLVIACRQCMVTTVRLLLSAKASVSYNNNMALGAILKLQGTLTDMSTMNDAFAIIKLLTEGVTLEPNVCRICLERTINIVFNCGHTMCDRCSNEMDKCPNCHVRIISRTELFL